jgi:hypothetical protein
MSTLEDTNPYKIAILLATRGRTKELRTSLTSLIVRATDISTVQFLIAFDRDDYIGYGYFNDFIKHYLDEKKITYQVIMTERYGYGKLQYYYNLLAKMASADWLFVWNDDATMDTQGWDKIITSHTGQFKLLSVITHNEHPYSIFPILPDIWVKLLGRISRHLEVDAEVSQMAYLLDIFERLPIYCTHYRPDILGEDKASADSTFNDKHKNLPSTDPNHPTNFNHPSFSQKRIQDVVRVAQYMKHIGLDTSWWESVRTGENKKPFAKLEANDPNKQVNTNIPRR